MKKYIWTAKAEIRARELGLEERKEGMPAVCGYGIVGGQTAQAWPRMWYIQEAKGNEVKSA